MIKALENWANANKSALEENGIKTVKVFINEFGGYIDHETKKLYWSDFSK